MPTSEKRIEVYSTDSGWDIQTSAHSIPFTCAPPYVEQVSDTFARIVIEVPFVTGRAVAQLAEIPMYPATPPAAEALARAGQAMASACHELTLVLKERK